MAPDALRIWTPKVISDGIRLVRRWREGNARDEVGPSRRFITPEDFQEELAVLGLSGRTFGPEEYVSALSDYLEISIAVHVIPDVDHPELARQLALSGRLGEIRYSDELRLAAVPHAQAV